LCAGMKLLPFVPAKAGTQGKIRRRNPIRCARHTDWIPACAGMNGGWRVVGRGNERNDVRNYFRSFPRTRGPRAKIRRRNPPLSIRCGRRTDWIPACAGMNGGWRVVGRGNERSVSRAIAFRSSPRTRGPRAKIRRRNPPLSIRCARRTDWIPAYAGMNGVLTRLLPAD
jgi:hypothetical protein